jgi:hypothetical protein
MQQIYNNKKFIFQNKNCKYEYYNMNIIIWKNIYVYIRTHINKYINISV